MIVFYQPDIQEGFSELSAEVSHHCIKVLRHRQGDIIFLLDGKGKKYRARIVQAHPKHCGVAIEGIESEQSAPQPAVHLLISPTKNQDRMEWLLEKATELGLTHFQPVLCQRTEKLKLRYERLEKVAISAMQQSMHLYKPVVGEMLPFKQLMAQWATNDSAQKFIAYIDSESKPPHIFGEIVPGKDCVILIGPEGDFTEEEVQIARSAGFQLVSLGKYRLRTETAGLVACHSVSLGNE
ncbi:MAG: RsmE family RNA methyltransferase [Chitinophagales bacterium]|nr:16S rRNA (uracil(1498)-N(3))-methyltransferase [Bacteroidota bacterium]MCB9042654.1 16S rRNA (uracil(1498)-N(3))-methyltransferase [Chitinophagales bacterium]